MVLFLGYVLIRIPFLVLRVTFGFADFLLMGFVGATVMFLSDLTFLTCFMW
jgi:hypothetical protein